MSCGNDCENNIEDEEVDCCDDYPDCLYVFPDGEVARFCNHDDDNDSERRI